MTISKEDRQALERWNNRALGEPLPENAVLYALNRAVAAYDDLAAKQAVSVEERDKLKAQLDAEGRVARLMNLNRGEIESGLDSHMTLSSYDGIYVQLHPDAFGIAFKLTEVGATKAERLIHALQQIIDKVRTGNLKGGWNGFR